MRLRLGVPSSAQPLVSLWQGGLGRYAASAAVAVVAVAAFALLLAAVAPSLTGFLRETITFTRKDFVSYSERRRCALASLTQ